MDCRVEVTTMKRMILRRKVRCSACMSSRPVWRASSSRVTPSVTPLRTRDSDGDVTTEKSQPVFVIKGQRSACLTLMEESQRRNYITRCVIFYKHFKIVFHLHTDSKSVILMEANWKETFKKLHPELCCKRDVSWKWMGFPPCEVGRDLAANNADKSDGGKFPLAKFPLLCFWFHCHIWNVAVGIFFFLETSFKHCEACRKLE